MGPREDESPAVLALPGVVDHDWQALVARGRTQGVVHAEDVAHVVRDVELTPDVLISVSDALAKLGIEIDDAVEVEADHDATPASGRRRRRQRGRCLHRRPSRCWARTRRREACRSQTSRRRSRRPIRHSPSRRPGTAYCRCTPCPTRRGTEDR